jgi:Fungal protein kinase
LVLEWIAVFGDVPNEWMQQAKVAVGGQLDLFIKPRTDTVDTGDWKDVRVIGEHRISRNDWKRKFLQIGRYVRDVFSFQPTRRFFSRNFQEVQKISWKSPSNFSNLLCNTQKSLTIPADFALLLIRIANYIHDALDKGVETCQ